MSITSPTLVVISGPPASGKTTLAHELARTIGCPAVCRDEIKEGMARGVRGYVPAPGDDLAWRTFETFFEVLRVLRDAGVTAVAEAAFQHELWQHGLSRLGTPVELRFVHCKVDADTAYQRRMERLARDPIRAVHEGNAPERSEVLAAHRAFVRPATGAPSIEVDTTDGYRPGIEAILAFVNAGL
jgi:predicted kinase